MKRSGSALFKSYSGKNLMQEAAVDETTTADDVELRDDAEIGGGGLESHAARNDSAFDREVM